MLHLNRHHFFRGLLSVGIFLTILLMILVGPARAYSVQAVDGYDLIDAVNGYRSANGLYTLNPEVHVMSAAQAHADWIVETGNGGHTGEGGSDETIRVGWTGYGNGGTIHCDEAWASGSEDVSAVVYSSWADWVHQAVMLDYWGNGYTDVGAGVSKDSNGRYVYVLDVCMISGKPSPLRPTAVDTPEGETSVPLPEHEGTYVFIPLVTAIPAADGSVIHVVGEGQALVQIALSYGVKVADIRKLNGMAEDWTLIYPGEKLIIFPKSSSITKTSTGTITASGTIEVTPQTATPAPTRTPRKKLATLVIPTGGLVQTSQPEKVNFTLNTQGLNKTGVTLVIVSVAGLVALLGWSIWGKK